MYLTHNSVYACAVSALILLPVVNLSPKINLAILATPIFSRTENFSNLMLLLAYFGAYAVSTILLLPT